MKTGIRKHIMNRLALARNTRDALDHLEGASLEVTAFRCSWVGIHNALESGEAELVQEAEAAIVKAQLALKKLNEKLQTSTR